VQQQQAVISKHAELFDELQEAMNELHDKIDDQDESCAYKEIYDFFTWLKVWYW